MTRTRATRIKASASASIELEPPVGAVWMTQAAFVLTLVLAIARAMMSETVREAFEVVIGGAAPPSGPGPTTTLALDLLCCVPALLVLGRRAVDRTYIVHWTWSQALLGLLAIWAAISIGWSNDRFLALLSAANTLAWAVLVWSTAQLVRSWLRLRIVAGVCLGLLFIYIAQGLVYRFADFPQNIQYWHEHKQEILQQRGWSPGSFEATQFEKKLLSGEMIGFNQSPNSFAAVIVLLMVVSAGVAIQRLASRDAAGWSILIAASFVPAGVVVYYTGSRTSAGTLLIAACLLIAIAPGPVRALMARRSGMLYGVGAAMCVLAAAALIGYGVRHHSLPQDSLNFRWRYWVASFKLWEHHRVLGVGWGNFGESYLAFRLPAAAEEIKDPHNFIVRCFTELGLIGGVLVLAWLLLAAWELTRPIAPAQPMVPQKISGAARIGEIVTMPPHSAGTVAMVAVVAAGGAGLAALAGIDWSQPGAYLILEVFRRVLAMGLLVIGLLAATARGRRDPELDDRPAPWVLLAMVIALGVFFIHNLIDFVIAEPGPLTLFGVVLGAALGLRTPPTAGKHPRRGIAAGFLAAGIVAWFAALFGVFMPVATAEEQANRGDDALRADQPMEAAGLYRSAFQSMSSNANYANRSAQALMRAGAPAEQILAMLDIAISTDPKNVSYFASRAEFRMQAPHPDAEQVRADYDRALTLDPENVQLRLEYGHVLETLGDRAGAATQYRDALRRNDLLNPDEPKRLPAARIEQIRQTIAALTAPATLPATLPATAR